LSDLIVLDLVFPGVFKLAYVVRDGLTPDAGRACFVEGLILCVRGCVQLGMRAFRHEDVAGRRKGKKDGEREGI
jgi:hypothetical protein